MADSEALAPIVGAWRERVNALEAALQELLWLLDPNGDSVDQAQREEAIVERARALVPEAKR